jgi:hypothetical protein
MTRPNIILCADCGAPVPVAQTGIVPKLCPAHARLAYLLDEVEALTAPARGARYKGGPRRGQVIEAPEIGAVAALRVARRLDRVSKRLLRRAGVL